MGNLVLGRIKRYRLEILYVCIAVMAALLPYLGPELEMGSDAKFHLARIDSLTEGLREGVFPVKLHTVLCYSYGYGVGFFYPNLFLYIPALFRILGCSLESTYKLYAGILFLGIFVSMYVCMWRATKDRMLALMAGSLYLFSYPVLGGFYHGFTLAQNQALVFLPPAIMGMFEFAGKDKKPWLLAVGFAGLIYSHTLTTVMAVGVCMVILLGYAFRWRGWSLWRHKLFWLAVAVFGVSCLTMAYWGPMFEQFAVQTYKVTQPWTHVWENVPSLHSLLVGDGLGVTLIIAILLMLLSLMVIKKGGSWEMKLSLLLGMLLMLLIPCRIFWEKAGNLFDFIQFPVRLTRPAAVLLIFALAWWLWDFRLPEKRKRALALIMLAACICTGLLSVRDDVGDIEDWDGRVIYEEIAGLGAGEEWLPVETTRDVMVNPLTAFSDEGEAFLGSRIGKDYYFEVDGSSDSYELPLVWYRGYQAENAEGGALEVTKNPENSLVVVKNTDQKGQKMTIHIWYAGTVCQKLSYAVSLLTLVAVIACKVAKRRGGGGYAI